MSKREKKEVVDNSGSVSVKENVEKNTQEINQLDVPEELQSFDIASRGKAKIIKIEKGKLYQFMSQKLLDRLLNDPVNGEKNKERLGKDALNITFQTLESGIIFRKAITITYGKNSNLSKFIKRYGKPQVGLEVEWILNNNNYPDLYL